MLANQIYIWLCFQCERKARKQGVLVIPKTREKLRKKKRKKHITKKTEKNKKHSITE